MILCCSLRGGITTTQIGGLSQLVIRICPPCKVHHRWSLRIHVCSDKPDANPALLLLHILKCPVWRPEPCSTVDAFTLDFTKTACLELPVHLSQIRATIEFCMELCTDPFFHLLEALPETSVTVLERGHCLLSRAFPASMGLGNPMLFLAFSTTSCAVFDATP